MSTYEGLWPLCETCGAVPTRHNDYKDCEKHMQIVARAYEAGRTNGIKQEREAVVAWLRGRQEAAEWALTAAGYEHAAEAIERGEHRREEKS